MGKKDERVDAYIAKAKPFAQPILKHLRKLILKADPNIEESIKWGMPFYDYKGPLCNIAAFKEHAVFGFWKTSLLKDPKGVLNSKHDAMGSLGKITNLKDLPNDRVILDLIKQAKKLNDDNVKLTPNQRKHSKPAVMPAYFKAALSKNKKAQLNYDKFPAGQKKDYIVWITDAKTEETRNKRLKTAMEWISDGKIRNWKYLKK